MATHLAHSTPLFEDFETAHRMLDELDKEESSLQQTKRGRPLLDTDQHRVVSRELDLVNSHRKKWKLMIKTLNRSLKQN
jgi:hypothetical protein